MTRRIRWIVLTWLFTGLPAHAVDPCPSEPGFQQINPISWGFDVHSTRQQARSDISKANIDNLNLKWAYGLVSTTPRSYPLVTEDTIFIGDSGSGVYALDRETGCQRWHHARDGDMGSGVLAHRSGNGMLVYINSRNEGIVALDGRNGAESWLAAPRPHPLPMYSGNGLPVGSTLFVPISSMEIALAVNPFYGCCETSGGLAAIDLNSGETRWMISTITEPVQVTGRRWLFIETHGPSGAPVWGSPSYDPQLDLVFFGTGQNYSHPATTTSDAIFAVNARDGSIRWTRQFTENDAYNMACNAGMPNCPDPMGPDLDFGAPPVLATRPDGSRILIAGQKSGDVHAMDPESGAVIWQRKLGRGGALGGVHWGIAVDNGRGQVLVPMSDLGTGQLTGEGSPSPGLFALDVNDGSIRWEYRRESRCQEHACWGGLSAAIAINTDLAFTGSLDGVLEALDLETGEQVWSFDTWREFDSVNGTPTSGGTLDAHGPFLVDDLLIVSSGYGSFGQRPGNAFLVFQLQEGAP